MNEPVGLYSLYVRIRVDFLLLLVSLYRNLLLRLPASSSLDGFQSSFSWEYSEKQRAQETRFKMDNFSGDVSRLSRETALLIGRADLPPRSQPLVVFEHSSLSLSFPLLNLAAHVLVALSVTLPA